MTDDERLAREEIRYTQSVYNSEGDRGRIDALLTAFTADGVLELDSGTYEGHDAIRGALSLVVDGTRADTSGPKPFIRHNLTTSRVEFVSDTEANGWTYWFVVTPIGFDHSGVYVDRFVKTGDRWLIAHRRVKVDWIDPESRFGR